MDLKWDQPQICSQLGSPLWVTFLLISTSFQPTWDSNLGCRFSQLLSPQKSKWSQVQSHRSQFDYRFDLKFDLCSLRYFGLKIRHHFSLKLYSIRSQIWSPHCLQFQTLTTAFIALDTMLALNLFTPFVSSLISASNSSKFLIWRLHGLKCNTLASPFYLFLVCYSPFLCFLGVVFSPLWFFRSRLFGLSLVCFSPL